MSYLSRVLVRSAMLVTIVVLLGACSVSDSNSTTDVVAQPVEDTSISTTLAATIGGALADTKANGTLVRSDKKSQKSLWAMLFNLIPDALAVAVADAVCPTMATTDASYCAVKTDNSKNAMYLGFGYASVGAPASGKVTISGKNCGFYNSDARWSGVMRVYNDNSAMTCGTYPTSGTVVRQVVAGQLLTGLGSVSNTTVASTPHAYFSAATSATSQGGGAGLKNFWRTSPLGVTVYIDHGWSAASVSPAAVGDLGNYEAVSIPKVTSSITTGWGNAVTLVGGKRTGMTVAQRVSQMTISSVTTAGAPALGTLNTYTWDHTIVGTFDVTETSASATSRTVSVTAGTTVKVYDNRNKVTGIATVTSLKYEDGCCTPTSGSITTTFTKHPTLSCAGVAAGAGCLADAYNGTTETVTFKSCGSATVVDKDGTRDVLMTACY